MPPAKANRSPRPHRRACRVEPLEDRRLLAGVPELVFDYESPWHLQEIFQPTSLNGALYFSARSDEVGRELWRSDGTHEGTVLVKDVWPGPDSGVDSASYRLGLYKVGGLLVFGGDDGEHGLELWRSDGTTQGTVLLNDILPGPQSSNPQLPYGKSSDSFYGVYEDQIYFRAGTESERFLWRTDGTSEGTFTTHRPDPDPNLAPLAFATQFGSEFFYSAQTQSGFEFAKGDGTLEGTVLVKDCQPGPGGSNPYDITNVNGTLFFTAVDGLGRKLWMSDGSPDGTMPVSFEPKQALELANVDGALFVVAGPDAGNELWKLEPISGDTNFDNVVDVVDFGRVKANFGRRGDNLTGELDYDGDVDLDDFGILKAHFGSRLSEPLAAAAGAPGTVVAAVLDGGATDDPAAQDGDRALSPETSLAPSLAGANSPPQPAGAPIAAAAVDLLPDLITWSDEDRGYLHGWTVETSPTRTLLRLTTGMANIGTGPLELRGSTSHPDGTQDVLQRIFRDDGTRFDRLAGTFVFHASHNHIHFEDFTEYNLRAVLPDNQVGEVVATSDKVSFCLVDFDDYDETLVGAPDVGTYHGCSSVQGISVGWADIYEEGLPDQWIDVTGVPAGQYWLEMIADPANHVLESNEDNNVSRILIDYPAPAALTPDRFEPNDSGEQSRNLGNAAELRQDDLTIHAAGNNDLYDWTAPRAGVLTVEIQFEHAQGDLSLLVYRDGPVEEIGLSVGDGDAERVIVPVSARSHYYFSVVGAGNATSPNYSLSLGLTDEAALHPADALEPNNTVGRATRLASADLVLEDLSIHSTTDVDWFRWVAPTTGRLQVSAGFSHAAGNLDLLVYDRQSRLLGSSTSLTDQEQVTVAVVAGQAYLFKTVGRDYATSPSYSLSVDGPELVPGDADLDGDVDLEDFAALKMAFGSTGEGIKTDFNRDGRVDLSDFGLLKANFSALVAGPPATVPRPAARTRPTARDPQGGQEALSLVMAIEAAFEQGQDELWWQEH